MWTAGRLTGPIHGATSCRMREALTIVYHLAKSVIVILGFCALFGGMLIGPPVLLAMLIAAILGPISGGWATGLGLLTTATWLMVFGLLLQGYRRRTKNR